MREWTGLSRGRALALVSARDARDLVTVGRLMDAPPVWLGDVAAGVTSGEVSVGAAAAIVTGLGEPSASLGADDLLDAAQTLVAEAGTLPPEKVAKRARELRDELDAAGVADREQALREMRSLRYSRRRDGMWQMLGLSSFLCKWVRFWGLEVGGDAVGVGECELFEGLLPVGGDGAFDESAGGFALLAG